MTVLIYNDEVLLTIFQMIYLNQTLEILNENLSNVSRLRKIISAESSSSLVGLASKLDPHQKGYLTANELCMRDDVDCLNYINRLLGARISYSGYVSYAQNIENCSYQGAWQNMTLTPQKMRELVIKQYQIWRDKMRIRGQISKYIEDKEGKISYKTFQNYCHSQKLRANPQIIFKALANNQDFIEVQNYIEKDGYKEKATSKNETVDKINRAQKNLKRLWERVDKFGAEWL